MNVPAPYSAKVPDTFETRWSPQGDLVSPVPQVCISTRNFRLPFDELETQARRSDHLLGGRLQRTPYLLIGACIGRGHFVQRSQNAHMHLRPTINDDCTGLPNCNRLKKCRAHKMGTRQVVTKALAGRIFTRAMESNGKPIHFSGSESIHLLALGCPSMFEPPTSLYILHACKWWLHIHWRKE